jgi:hypothetical protein
VTPRLFGTFGAGGVALVQPFTVTAGRPPANASVVPIASVRAPPCVAVSVNLMVTGPTDLKVAIGKDETDEAPTVYVIGPQEDMRESDGL